MYCSQCGKQVLDDSVFCSHCGKEIDITHNKKEKDHIVKKIKSLFGTILLTVAIIIVVLGIISYLRRDNDKNDETMGNNIKNISSINNVDSNSPVDNINNKKKSPMLLSVVKRYSDGKYSGKDIYEYDSNGNKTSSISYDEDDNEWRRLKYNLNGIVVEDIQVFSGIKNVEKYDDKGNILSKTEYRLKDDTKRLRTEYIYNSEGKCVGTESYNENGNQTGYSFQEYDINGNNYLVLVYTGEGSLRFVYEYTYDSNGNKISEIESDGKGNISIHREFKYTPTSKIETELRFNPYANDVLSFKAEYEYDKTDNLIFISEEYYDDEGTIIGGLKTEYTSDDEGNTILIKIISSDGKVLSLSEYENTYISLEDYLNK